MLQRLLAAHPAVATTAEPFVLLPMAYSLRRTGARTEYGPPLAAEAIEQFCAELPGGVDDYRSALRQAATDLYERASGGAAEVFIDKTPAYSLVPDSVREIFPDAACIFLWRNPLAVAASMSESWYDGRWTFRAHADYLTLGLPRLLAAYRADEARVLSLRYEDLLTSPAAVLERAFSYLDLPHDADVVEAFSEVELRGDRKDSWGMERYRSISEEPLTKWAEAFHTPVRRAWGRRYLDWLGADRLALMGYDAAELAAALDRAPNAWSALPGDVAAVALHLVQVNARARILRQEGGFRWL